MRIVIDMQGAQTGSRLRGIGRYVTALVKAMARHRGDDEIVLALNGDLPDSVSYVRAEFAGLLSDADIRVWHAPTPVCGCDPANTQRRKIAERIREAFLASLSPDVVLIGSLFEGFGDGAATSAGVFDRQTPTAVVLYDLLPLTHPDTDHDSAACRSWYGGKIASLTRCDLFLAISEYSKREALAALPLAEEDIVTIMGACDSSFSPRTYGERAAAEFRARFGLSRPFVMYAGGADERKNLHRLIRSYAALPHGLSRSHQLVIVGDMPQSRVDALRATAADCGLGGDDMRITGYVDEDCLLQFYASCALFVFPSLLEGLGLPPLEAMACGAPVIAANAASIPEVVGNQDALFDPRSVESMRDTMAAALVDGRFRAALVERGLEQAKRFSWDITARRALETLRNRVPSRNTSGHVVSDRPRLFARRRLRILVLKLDHLGDFVLALPAIGKLRARYPYADIDIAVGSWNAALAERTGLFRQVHVFDCLARGKHASVSFEDFLSRLGRYDIAIDLRRQRDTRFVLARVEAGLRVGYQSFDDGVDSQMDILLPAHPDTAYAATPMNRIHAGKQMLALVDALPEDENDYIAFPDIGGNARRAPGVVAVFPGAGNAIKAWDSERYDALVGMLAQSPHVEGIAVFFSGDDERAASGIRAGKKVAIHAGLTVPELIETLSGCSVCVANNSGGAHLASYLGLATVCVYGGHETAAEWAPAFGDAMVLHRDAFCSPCHNASREDCPHHLFCLDDIPVELVHNRVLEALARSHESESGVARAVPPDRDVDTLVETLVDSLAGVGDMDDELLAAVSSCVAESFMPGDGRRRLFVDISELARSDAGTGIQRVVGNVLANLWQCVPVGWEVVPVLHRSGEAVFRKAAAYARRSCGHPLPGLDGDDPITWRGGDVFFGLDLNLAELDSYGALLAKMRGDGVRVEFLVYDLLCVTMPQHFIAGMPELFSRWLRLVADADGAVCISEATAGALTEWLRANAPERLEKLAIRHTHIGADFHPARGADESAAEIGAVLEKFGDAPTFLMVSTLEPRKGHAQFLAAFELLWEEGIDANLVIVGRQGWLVDELARAIRAHALLDRCLFWLEGISDACLDRVYAAGTCLIAASEGEGFGLFLIEAAQHRLPIIARDLAVFREVAGAHAFYFDGDTPEALAATLREWLALWRRGSHPRSEAMPWLTWRQCTENIAALLCGTRDANGQ